jgi:mannose-6-phosphate isomerase-like protein (cupin superfamily)
MSIPCPLIRAAAMRRTETPNAVMTTVASPTQGPTSGLSVWRVSMRRGQQGPPHVFDAEQVWHVVVGRVQIEIDDVGVSLTSGDAVVVPAGTIRQVSAVTDTELVVAGTGTARVSVPGEPASRGTPAWIA